MKIYAKQVPPEHQISPFDPEYWPGIIFFGNARYLSYTTWEFDAVRNRFSTEKRILRGLHLLTGRRYEKRTIYGSEQSDWQEIYYPAADYTPELLELLAAEYFNTGTEWIIDLDGDNVSVYAYSWNNDNIRVELAATIGVEPENIILQAFTGWKQTAEYAEV